MCSKLYAEIGKREETMCVVETLLVFAMAALYFAVVSWSVGTDQLVPDSKPRSGQFKTSESVFPAGREAVGKLKSVVCLHTLYPHTAALELGHHFLQEIGGRIGALFWICSQIAQPCILVDRRILVQLFFRVCQAFQRHHLHIHLHTLAGILHLFVWFCPVRRLGLGLWEHPQLSHDPEQAFRAAGVTALAKPVPEFHHSQCWIPSSHIPDELELCLRMLVGMVVRASGLAGQGCHTSIPACLPEVDIRPAFVVLPARTAHAVFGCILHQGLPILHVLCYTFTHEGQSSFLGCLVLQLNYTL